MNPIISYSESGGASLYIRLGRTINVDGGTWSVKIKKVMLEVTYDQHALSIFTAQQIIDDFWGKIVVMCEEMDIEWRNK